VLWLHWLGQIHNDRSEFLSEAVDLAGQGVVSILPQGHFPWVPDPDGTAGDVALVRNQVAAYRAVLDRLVAEKAVDPDRIAVVGHDYGAMYGALLADRDRRVSVLAMQAPDSLWGNWFATYWLGLEGPARQDYYELFAGLDPVEHVSRLRSHVLFQWAGRDEFVPEAVRDAFVVANPRAKSILYPNADHQLTDAAIADLTAFLSDQLDLHD
jgi:pimeloyl-ACP methyl ester carboxylesterase